MPRDDREQNFDKALARHLGSTSAAQGNDCLDAETLAAYHERLLDPEEMAQHKAHIASCERCQEILAQLEATDPILVEADRDLMLDQIVLEIPESEPAPDGAAAVEIEPQLEASPEPPAKLQPHAEEVTHPMAVAPQAEVPAAPVPETTPELEIEHELDLVAASAAPPSLTQSQASSREAAASAPAVPVFPAAAKSAPPSSSTITFRSPREDRPKLVRFVAIFGAIAAAVVFWLVFRDQNKSFDLAQNHQQKLEMPPQSPAPAPPADEKATASVAGSSQPNTAASRGDATAPPATHPQQSLSKTPTDSATNALDEGKNALDAAKALELKTKKDAAAQAPTFIPRDDSSSLSAAASLRSPRSNRQPAKIRPCISRRESPRRRQRRLAIHLELALHHSHNSAACALKSQPRHRQRSCRCRFRFARRRASYPILRGQQRPHGQHSQHGHASQRPRPQRQNNLAHWPGRTSSTLH